MASARRKPKHGAGGRARERAEPDSEWLTGLHAVGEALRAGRRRLDRLWIRKQGLHREHRALLDRARALGLPVEEVEDELLATRAPAEGNIQGVALEVGRLPELSLGALLEEIREREGPSRILALDGVEDPQNVGALARVAEASGVCGLLLTRRRAPRLTPAVARASAGAIEWLSVARVGNLARALGELQQAGFWVLAAAPGGEAPLYEMPDDLLTGNLVVVLGAEGRGVRPSTLERSDHRVEIPMRGRVESLNVSTAGAVILYDLLRRAKG